MVCLRVILIIALVWINGCSRTRESGVAVKSRTMHDVYHRSSDVVRQDIRSFAEERFKEEKRFGYVTPYIPIVNQAEVRKVWVPDHKDKDDPDVMIAGHWVYLMVRPASWFIDERTAQERVSVIVPTSPHQGK